MGGVSKDGLGMPSSPTDKSVVYNVDEPQMIKFIYSFDNEPSASPLPKTQQNKEN